MRIHSCNNEILRYHVQIVEDMPCWIHRGAIADAQKISMGLESNAIAKFVCKRLDLLAKYNIKAVCVFDGKKLPAKRLTNQKRRERREERLKEAKKALRDGDPRAYQLFCGSIRITAEIINSIRAVCEKRGLECVMSPYEADSQLAFLSRNNFVDAVLTEDSDLFIFDAKILVVKLDEKGYCKKVSADRIDKVDALKDFETEKLKWFRYACILQGCDYYPAGLKGIGLKTALKVLKQALANGDDNFNDILANHKQYVAEKMSAKWTEEDINGLLRANECFDFQLVFNTSTRKVEPLTTYPEGQSDADYAHCGTITDHDDLMDKTDGTGINSKLSSVKKEVKKELNTNPENPMVMKNFKRKRQPSEQSSHKRPCDDSWKLDLNSPKNLNLSEKLLQEFKPVYPTNLDKKQVEDDSPKLEYKLDVKEVSEKPVASIEVDSSGSELEIKKQIKRENKNTKRTKNKPTNGPYWASIMGLGDSESEDDEQLAGYKKVLRAKESVKDSVPEQPIIPEKSAFDEVFEKKSNNMKKNGSPSIPKLLLFASHKLHSKNTRLSTFRVKVTRTIHMLHR